MSMGNGSRSQSRPAGQLVGKAQTAKEAAGVASPTPDPLAKPEVVGLSGMPAAEAEIRDLKDRLALRDSEIKDMLDRWDSERAELTSRLVHNQEVHARGSEFCRKRKEALTEMLGSATAALDGVIEACIKATREKDDPDVLLDITRSVVAQALLAADKIRVFPPIVRPGIRQAFEFYKNGAYKDNAAYSNCVKWSKQLEE